MKAKVVFKDEVWKDYFGKTGEVIDWQDYIMLRFDDGKVITFTNREVEIQK